MPSVRFDESWVPGFRSAVRTSTAEGWSVREHRGGMRLQVRQPGASMQTVALPFDWARRSTGDALVRIRNIYALVHDGHTVRSAADLLEGKAPAAVRPWQQAAERFRDQKLLHGNAIQPSTWAKNYEPVVSMAVDLLSATRAPARPEDLLDQCIRDWPPGSRARQIRAQSLTQFLRYCVDREGFPDLWTPPIDLRSHVGMKATSGAVSQKGDPLTDQQILELLAGLPADRIGQRWSDAVRLCSELGLRPIELLHLSVRRDPGTRERHWWCSYRKRSGGGATEPRRLEPLPLIDGNGQVQRWELIERWQAGSITLPPLESGNGAADCLKTYLNRQSAWQQLKQDMAQRGERLVPYSFRHSYSLRCHQRGIDGGSAAAAMGHSYEVHCRSYPWASEAGVVAAFQRARAQAEDLHL
ncbi:site-specific integrase [Synechococcus sp. CS-1328]|uniref:site-specific integrase n=1 Tax=Synechococcus sp. CS-1328 TaxID=2847976 RepID=UPI00223AEF65|nr:site-specific integrase [Synechococcus sp. CS-1328]MCT0223866.1 site-specific integrase [Synechococcus sp. CS-1328]